jgi:hypothetical protein
MFHVLMSLFVILLFVVLTPGVLIRLPPRSTLLTSAIVHGVVFALVFNLTHKLVLNYFYEVVCTGSD